ncbi:hypothetical protein, partial [Salmonella enterica]|uniref:hypothetical protein n=1 Tax=Salmonella enterica TaxID=28901 RepID=UPI002FCDA1CD
SAIQQPTVVNGAAKRLQIWFSAWGEKRQNWNLEQARGNYRCRKLSAIQQPTVVNGAAKRLQIWFSAWGEKRQNWNL